MLQGQQQGEEGGMGQVEPAKAGQTRNCQGWNFWGLCAVTDPVGCSISPTGSCSWGWPGRNRAGRDELFQHHRDRAHCSPVITRTSAQGCGEGWGWDPSLQASLPIQAHLQCHGAALCVPFPVWSRTGGFKVSPLSVPPSAPLFPGAELCLIQALYLFSFSMHPSGALLRHKIIKMTVPR